MNVAEAIRATTERLTSTSDTARLDAELLMAHVLNVSRSDLLLRHMGDPAPDGFAAVVERRAGGEPLAHITSHQEFYGLDLMITRDTLIPRGDSETLIEAALALVPPPQRILDLGTGSGALLLAVLIHVPGASGVALDRSAAALAVAMENARRLGLVDRVENRCADWHRPGWRKHLGTFDLILCNPPYVEESADLAPSVRDFEPAGALFAGPDGLDDYRVLIPQLRLLMNPHTAAIFEIGFRQADAVSVLAEENGFFVALRRDLAGRPRALILTL